MNRFTTSWGGTLFCLAGLYSTAARADQIVLKNGDRITGGIVKKDGNDLTIKSDLFGVIMAPWDKVESVVADSPLNVATRDGKTLRGTIATSNGALEIASATTTAAVPPSAIATLRNSDEQRAWERLQRPGWDQLWTGGASVGWAGSQGNARTNILTAGMNADRVTRTDKTSVHFNSIRSTAFSSGRNSLTAQAIRGGISYDHNISSRIFTNTFNDYEYDRFQNLDLRFALGGGFGIHTVRTENARLDLVGGGDFSHASYSQQPTAETGEAYFGDDYTRKLGKLTTIHQTFRLFNDLSTWGSRRFNLDAGAAVKITKWLNWSVSLSDRYVSIPQPDKKSTDILYTTGLNFTFSR